MPEKGPAPPRVSWRRIVLLATFGALASMALTSPGKWAAWQLFAPLRAEASAWLPLRLEVVTGPASRQIEALRLFVDMHNDGDQAAGSVPVPSPDQVAARLSHLDGWTRAILFELGAEATELNEAGVTDRMLCAKIAGSFCRPSPSARAALRSSPIRTWTLLLLDGRDRQVAAVYVSALRPGLAMVREYSFVEDPAAPGDGPLPAISLFRRTATGEVLTD